MKIPEAIQDKLIDVGDVVLRNSNLDIKTKALIGLACAVTGFCSHCHGQCVSLAWKLGASPAEIEEAEAIALRIRERCNNETGLYRLSDSS
ncbi:MAG: carboxymuconolactone decarboxylase family protein [Kiritimatiellae bacterium]|nr:carboxymuconolactone decarboxylase family protein [Kiritimatiellia bacterium]